MGYKPKWYDNKEFLKMLYIEQGRTIDNIAEYIGITSETVRQLLIKHKIKEYHG